MITELTKEQQDLIPIYAKKWRAIGLSTEDYDKKEIEELVTSMYQKKGFAKPRFFHCDSPNSLLWSYICYSILTEEGKDLNEANIREVLSREIDSKSYFNTANFCYGSFDAYWIARYDYFNEVLRVPGVDIIQDLVDMCKVNWWLPLEDVCFISRNPTFIHLDSDDELHCETGPALSYIDGFNLYFIHGVEVNEQVVMSPETLTLTDINAFDNIELKRIAIQRLGWDKYLEFTKAKPIDSKMVTLSSGISWLETLYSVSDEDLECNILVTCDPSTSRVYFLEVPADCNSCREAQIYMNGTETFTEMFDDNVVFDDYPVIRT